MNEEFNKKFPSLKGQEMILKHDGELLILGDSAKLITDCSFNKTETINEHCKKCGYDHKKDVEVDYFPVIPLEIIQESCLDKSLVEKAIDDIREDLFSGRNWKLILKQKLGLK